jgi:hypothetical protein
MNQKSTYEERLDIINDQARALMAFCEVMWDLVPPADDGVDLVKLSLPGRYGIVPRENFIYLLQMIKGRSFPERNSPHFRAQLGDFVRNRREYWLACLYVNCVADGIATTCSDDLYEINPLHGAIRAGGSA